MGSMADGLETDPWVVVDPAMPSREPREVILEQVSALLEPEFERLVFEVAMPTEYLAGTRMERAIALVRYMERYGQLGSLERRLESYARRAAARPSLPPPPRSFMRLPSLSQAFARLPSLSQRFPRVRPATPLRRRALPIASLAGGAAAALLGGLWPTEARLTERPGELSAGIVDFAMGPAWRGGPDAPGRLATDAVITSLIGQKPILELTRVFDARVTEAGDMGLGWRLLQPYSIKRSDEVEEVGSLAAPSSVVLRNQIAGSESRLTLGSRSPIRYVGTGLAPWTSLTALTTSGAFLADGRGNEIEFEPDMSTSVIVVGDARWMLQHEHPSGRIVALQTIPRALLVKSKLSDGSPAVVDVDDPLDPVTFELQGEGSQRALRPRTTGRWEKIITNKDASTASLVDRWGNELYFQPLDKFYMLDPNLKAPAMSRSGSGILFSYDSYGRVQTADLGAAGRVSYEYDASGRLAAVVDARGQRTEYRYAAGSAPAAFAAARVRPIQIALWMLAAVLFALGGWKLRR